MYIEFTLYGTGENADELEKFIDSSGVGETTEIESVGDKDEFVVGAHIDFFRSWIGIITTNKR